MVEFGQFSSCKTFFTYFINSLFGKIVIFQKFFSFIPLISIVSEISVQMPFQLFSWKISLCCKSFQIHIDISCFLHFFFRKKEKPTKEQKSFTRLHQRFYNICLSNLCPLCVYISLLLKCLSVPKILELHASSHHYLT